MVLENGGCEEEMKNGSVVEIEVSAAVAVRLPKREPLVSDPLVTDGAAKTNFDDVYDAATPIRYMARMHSVGYEIPENARPVFEALVRHIGREKGRAVRVLDIGASYGVNAALLRHQLRLSDLYTHYEQSAHLRDDPSALADADKAYFTQLPQRLDVEIFGLDVSAQAVRYAQRNGLLWDGEAVDLEDETTRATGLGGLEIDLITSTGVVGYIGPRTFERLLDVISPDSAVWIASFVLRAFDFGPCITALSSRGFDTEAHTAAFAQRRICSAQEEEWVFERVRSRGLHPGGLEDTGRLFADFYLSRPRDSAGDHALADLLGTNGAGKVTVS